MTPSSSSTTGLADAVNRAVAAVDDPEYPGVSIVDLGLVETVGVTGTGRASIGLIPTFSGCPALEVIATDVRDAASAVTGVTAVDVHWLTSPTWSSHRITARARKVLADRFTVAVGNDDQAATCPRCGDSTVEQSTFGPTRCRAVHRCSGCAEVVEVLRA